MNFLPERTKLNSDQCAERLINLNAHLHWVRLTRKIYELFLLYDSAKPHTIVCTTETITNSGYTVLLHPNYSPDLASSDYHLFGPVTKINLWRHHYASDEALQNVMHQWLHGREREQLLLDGNTCFRSEVEKESHQWWRLHWKTPMPSAMLYWYFMGKFWDVRLINSMK